MRRRVGSGIGWLSPCHCPGNSRDWRGRQLSPCHCPGNSRDWRGRQLSPCHCPGHSRDRRGQWLKPPIMWCQFRIWAVCSFSCQVRFVQGFTSDWLGNPAIIIVLLTLYIIIKSYRYLDGGAGLLASLSGPLVVSTSVSLRLSASCCFSLRAVASAS